MTSPHGGEALPSRFTALWPLNYLATGGPRADPVTGLVWGLLILSIAVVVIVSISVFAGVLVRAQRRPAALSTAPVGAAGGGLAWIYVGMPLTVLALAIALFWTMQVLAKVDAPPRRPSLTLNITGHQWWWEVRYLEPNGTPAFSTANEIHIPVGQPVQINLFGADVIHSFWIPALTGKTDTIPGRKNMTWLQAEKPGTYLGQCTEYCGVQHAHMAALVIAQSPTSFAAWAANQSKPAATPNDATAASGERVFSDHCAKCHAIAGTAAKGHKGPDLTHVMDRTTIASGVLTNTIDNLSGWISDPQTQKPGAKMPPTYLSGPELHAVVAYLESLR